MRRRNGVLVGVAGVALGVLTGTFVLPGSGLAGGGNPAGPLTAVPSPPQASNPTPTPTSGSTSTPTPSGTASTPSTGGSTVTEANLLPVTAFTDQSLEVTYARQRETDRLGSATACQEGDAQEGRSTLFELTGRNPVVWGIWGETTTDDTADEIIAVSPDAESAIGDVSRLLEAQRSCQTAEKGHWVWGPVQTLNVTSQLSSSTLGYYDGQLNTTGRAPKSVEPCGGVAFARNGRRFAVVRVYICADSVQLAGLAQAAARQLG